MNPDELIVCKSCGQPKPLAEYPSRPRSKSGHISICKVCHGKRISAGHSVKSPSDRQVSNPKFAGLTPRELISSLKEIIAELKCRGYHYKGELSYLHKIKL